MGGREACSGGLKYYTSTQRCTAIDSSDQDDDNDDDDQHTINILPESLEPRFHLGRIFLYPFLLVGCDMSTS